ncbi:MAG: hypothetical protein J3Q66DRAFT_395233 [Benniella sp.]|nr:MAG: hypothetical protein J3Q66DRAFT_395233 [Benniella sp.]
MESSPSPSHPSPPEGFMYAGPASDFLPSPHTDSAAGDTDEHLAVGCQTPGTSCTPELKTTKDGEEYLIKVIEIPQPAGRYPPQRRVAVSYFNKKWYAFINICPHQGSALARGSMMDIEDMGIVWGAGITCTLHNW